MSIIFKAPVLLVAWAFWAVIGLFIWTRVLVINFLFFAMMIALAPFGRGPPDPEPSKRFDRALGLYWYGFARIWRSVTGEHEAPDNLWDENEQRGIWGTLGNFVWQTGATLAFWAPIALVLHFSGAIDIGLVSRAERALGGAVETALQERTPAQAEAATGAATCLGVSAIARLNPPQRFVTTRDVNVRRGPGTEHERIERLQGNQDVLVVGRSPSGQWALVSIDGQTRCFINTDYLRPAR